jgi:hypothetical protein
MPMLGVMAERCLNTPEDIQQKTSQIRDVMESLYVLVEHNRAQDPLQGLTARTATK